MVDLLDPLAAAHRLPVVVLLDLLVVAHLLHAVDLLDLLVVAHLLHVVDLLVVAHRLHVAVLLDLLVVAHHLHVVDLLDLLVVAHRLHVVDRHEEQGHHPLAHRLGCLHLHEARLAPGPPGAALLAVDHRKDHPGLVGPLPVLVRVACPLVRPLPLVDLLPVGTSYECGLLLGAAVSHHRCLCC